MIEAYYRLTKPGVLFGNVITAAAGFLLASKGTIDWLLFLATIVGTTLVIAAACVLNNYLDQDIDSVMERTKKRPLLTGDVSERGALIFCAVLFAIGFFILAFWVNYLVGAIGLVGFVTYVWLYGAMSKRRSIQGTLVGSVSGAMPIFAGYDAVAGQIDLGAILVFAILYIWQMPEV
jgi:protoheme IX farnesyltransferase